MKRAVRVLVGASSLAVSATAFAWDANEHASFGKTAIDVACSSPPDSVPPACSAANRALVAKALAEPDSCNSYWFSDTGIAVNSTDGATRSAGLTGCNIQFGSPGAFQLPQFAYILDQNASHFGDNTLAHFNLWHALATQAANLAYTFNDQVNSGSIYPAPPVDDGSLQNPNPLASVCATTALAIEGFALHYQTDRTSTAHGWTAQPRYDGSNLAMSLERSCFHGHYGGLTDLIRRWVQGIALPVWGFSCVDGKTDTVVLLSDGLPTSTHVLAGLGDIAQSFGGASWGTGSWIGDDQFIPSVLPFPSAQEVATLKPAEDALGEILTTLTAGSADTPAWQDTFVSNHDFCKVALAECCRDASTGSGVSSLGTCGTCVPDITAAALKNACPVLEVRSNPVLNSKGSLDPDWVPLEVSRKLLPNSVYYAHLNVSALGMDGSSGVDVARSLAHMASYSTNAVNQDALWDQNNDVIGASGCTEFNIMNATFPPIPLDPFVPTNLSLPITYKGNPKFPLTVHWHANADCSAPPGMPLFCADRTYVASQPPPTNFGTSTSGSWSNLPPITIPNFSEWACPGAQTGAQSAKASGVLYITDSNTASNANGATTMYPVWTNAYPTDIQCGMPAKLQAIRATFPCIYWNCLPPGTDLSHPFECSNASASFNDTVILTAVDANGNPVADPDLQWTSSNPAIATVTSAASGTANEVDVSLGTTMITVTQPSTGLMAFAPMTIAFPESFYLGGYASRPTLGGTSDGSECAGILSGNAGYVNVSLNGGTSDAGPTSGTLTLAISPTSGVGGSSLGYYQDTGPLTLPFDYTLTGTQVPFENVGTVANYTITWTGTFQGSDGSSSYCNSSGTVTMSTPGAPGDGTSSAVPACSWTSSYNW